MVKKAGEKTCEFGLWLTKYILENYTNQGYQVYYDHGDSKLHNNVASIKGFLGDTVTSKNKLADLDVMVANQDHEILMLIEIEESPLSPKTLFGDIFASLFSTQFAVRVDGEQTYFSITNRTRLLVAGYVPQKTRKKSNLMIEIRSRLADFSAPEDSILMDQVDIVIEEDLNRCLDFLKRNVIDILN